MRLAFKFFAGGAIRRVIDVGASIRGYVLVDQVIYVLLGTEQGKEDWRIARLDPRQEGPEVKGRARIPFSCRSFRRRTFLDKSPARQRDYFFRR